MTVSYTLEVNDETRRLLRAVLARHSPRYALVRDALTAPHGEAGRQLRDALEQFAEDGVLGPLLTLQPPSAP